VTLFLAWTTSEALYRRRHPTIDRTLVFGTEIICKNLIIFIETMQLRAHCAIWRTSADYTNPLQSAQNCIESKPSSWGLYSWEASFPWSCPALDYYYIIHLGQRFINAFNDLLALIDSRLDSVQLKETEKLVGNYSVMLERIHTLKSSSRVIALIFTEILTCWLHLHTELPTYI